MVCRWCLENLIFLERLARKVKLMVRCWNQVPSLLTPSKTCTSPMKNWIGLPDLTQRENS